MSTELGMILHSITTSTGDMDVSMCLDSILSVQGFCGSALSMALTVRVVWNRFYIDSIVHCTQNKHVINNVLFSIRMNIVQLVLLLYFCISLAWLLRRKDMLLALVICIEDVQSAQRLNIEISAFHSSSHVNHTG